jgi:cytidylate kinase
MNTKRIITVAGKPGSGKSTTAKILAKELGYDHFSSGDLFRSVAKEQGQDVLQANKGAEKDSSIDHLVDQKLRDIGKNEDKKVIDSRTAWHWMPRSFKVYLALDFESAAERILSNMDQERIEAEHIPSDPKDYAEVLSARLDSENGRYDTLYGINPGDEANYDLVVDTSTHSPQEVANIILEAYERHHSQ